MLFLMHALHIQAKYTHEKNMHLLVSAYGNLKIIVKNI